LTVTAMKRIYLDHAATTPVAPEVLDAMLPYFRESYGNPSSLHHFGRESRRAVTEARDLLADYLGCSPSELVFTGGGTESDNLALFGAAEAYLHSLPEQSRGARGHIITSSVEHHAVLYACERLEREGFRVTYLPVDATGRIRLDELEEALAPDTFLVSLMMGNNEVGTLQPIAEAGAMLQDRGIIFHVDAVQAFGCEDIRLDKLPVDLMSFSAHKINGPKGVGALYLNRRLGKRWVPQSSGGGQERGRRSGTENVPGIVGFGQAARRLQKLGPQRKLFLEKLRHLFIETLQASLANEEFAVNGHPEERLPHIVNVSFPGADTATLLMNLDLEGVAAASGSACSAGSHEISHVLKAMRLSPECTASAVRFSFGLDNTPAEAEAAAKITATIVRRIRNR